MLLSYWHQPWLNTQEQLWDQFHKWLQNSQTYLGSNQELKCSLSLTHLIFVGVFQKLNFGNQANHFDQVYEEAQFSKSLVEWNYLRCSSSFYYLWKYLLKFVRSQYKPQCFFLSLSLCLFSSVRLLNNVLHFSQ